MKVEGISELNAGICGCLKCHFPHLQTPQPLSDPTHCPIGPVMLVTPEILFNFWKVLFFPPQGLGQRPGAAGGLQVLGLIGDVAALLLIHVDVDAVQSAEEQQHRQDDKD